MKDGPKKENKRIKHPTKGANPPPPKKKIILQIGEKSPEWPGAGGGGCSDNPK